MTASIHQQFGSRGFPAQCIIVLASLVLRLQGLRPRCKNSATRLSSVSVPRRALNEAPRSSRKHVSNTVLVFWLQTDTTGAKVILLQASSNCISFKRGLALQKLLKSRDNEGHGRLYFIQKRLFQYLWRSVQLSVSEESCGILNACIQCSVNFFLLLAYSLSEMPGFLNSTNTNSYRAHSATLYRLHFAGLHA